MLGNYRESGLVRLAGCQLNIQEQNAKLTQTLAPTFILHQAQLALIDAAGRTDRRIPHRPMKRP